MRLTGLLALLLSGMISFSSAAASDIYKYRAADGTILFTD